jgi:hypothetical protein
MCRRTVIRTGLSVALTLSLAPIWFAFADSGKPKTEYFKGKVVPLAGLVEKAGTKLDADAAPYWLALVSDDCKIYPLIKDDGSRMIFKDKTLLDRPMRLTGKLLPDSQLLQVVEVHSYHQGQLHEVYYWCDICTIKRFEKKICDCCGGPMELREVPVTK